MCSPDDDTAERALTFETMLTDPLIRQVMDSDGVSMADLVNVLVGARRAVVAREAAAYRAVA